MLAVEVLLLPMSWLLGWLLAVSVHECGHYLALKCCRVPVSEIRIGLLGANMFTAPLSPTQELICAAAGPIGSFLLLILADRLPIAAMIGLVQGVFNLLPFYPLDGGRMVRAAWKLLSESGC